MSRPRRTVRPYPITAYAACCGLGRTTSEVIDALAAGRRGLSPCPLEVPFATVTGTVPGALPPPPERFARNDSRIVRLALLGFEDLAAGVAAAIDRWGPDRVALVLGTSTGGIGETERAHVAWRETGALPEGYDYEAQHPFHVFAHVLRAHAGVEGPAYVVSTACSSSAKVLASARRLLDAGVADAVIAGGVDALCHTTVRGFHSLGVMAEGPCRPFGADRPGMNVGEGAAFMLVEREGEARATLLGVGETSDAYHMSSPDPEGAGALAAMNDALAQGGLDPSAIDHVNAHGTGTAYNDAAEAKAIYALFGDRVPVASTKGYTGHTLGACGALEAIFAIASIERGFVPASVGAHPSDPAIRLSLPEARVDRPVRHVLSNSFAFGGNNCSVLLGGSR